MPVRTSSVASFAAAIALAFAIPAAFAADQMSNSQNSATSTMAPSKSKDTAMTHSGGDSMSHTGSGKMSGGSDSAMTHDKMSK